LLAVLADGPVRIRPVDGPEIVAAVHGGFLSVSESGVSVLAEVAELSTEIDVSRAQRSLEEARSAGADDAEAEAARRRAETRIRVAQAG
jgi:F-type H+-transporting ATPase subunit epsilon